MADYIYLLQSRLTPAQQGVLSHIQTLARARALTLFLVGGAVRDLTSGSPIRDLDLALQGNALKLKKDIEKLGGISIGEDEPGQRLFFNFPGGVRLELGSTLSVTFPKPGKPVYTPATILEDLRRRDFTANAMALSLNDGSFGLLMDPLNGIADLENRELRLVSNYGFIEDPARMIRAARFSARLGWTLEEKTRQRYETGKTEGYISALSPAQRAYELEEIFHEEDPLRVLRRLEAEGWAKVLFPAWTSKQVNEGELERLRDTVGHFEAMGIFPDTSAAAFPLLTARLPPKDVASLKKAFFRPGFATQIAALEPAAKAFSSALTSKEAAAPSAAWKLIHTAEPEHVLALAHSVNYANKTGPVPTRFKAFFGDWSQARTRIPYQLMQEMRIVPELPVYAELLDKLFFAIMDGKLDTPEAARAFLEPFSPPAPPPPVNLRRRAVKRETKAPKSRSRKVVDADLEADLGGDALPAADKPETMKPAATRPIAPKTPAKPAPVKAAAVKAAPVKAAVKPASKAVPAKAPARVAPAKPAAKPVAKKSPTKAAPAKPAASKVVAKPAAKPTAKKVTARPPAKPTAKKAFARSAPAKAPVKAASKKPAAKPVARKASARVVTKPTPKKPAGSPAKKIVKPVVAKKSSAKAAPKKPTAAKKKR